MSNTEKRVQNTMQSGVFLTNFEGFDIVMKHCDKCLIINFSNELILKGKIKDAKTGSFSSVIHWQTRHGA